MSWNFNHLELNKNPEQKELELATNQHISLELEDMMMSVEEEMSNQIISLVQELDRRLLTWQNIKGLPDDKRGWKCYRLQYGFFEHRFCYYWSEKMEEMDDLFLGDDTTVADEELVRLEIYLNEDLNFKGGSVKSKKIK